MDSKGTSNLNLIEFIHSFQIAIDETLILFKGRYKYCQHIKGKPNSTGLKLYGLADIVGFLWKFWFYKVLLTLIFNLKQKGKSTKNTQDCARSDKETSKLQEIFE